MDKYRHLVGKKFNHLTFVSISETRSADKHVVALWQCECGNFKEIQVTRVINGDRISCGCKGRESFLKKVTKHGMRNTTEYRTWSAINGRCHSETNKDFQKYGAKGIRVCDEWRNSFESFFSHIGLKPEKSMQIDRIDNTRGYEPGNVRWVTPKKNSSNRSGSLFWSINGEVFDSISDAAEHFNVSAQTIFRWVNGMFDKRRNSFLKPKEGCFCIPKYNNGISQ